MEEEMIRLLMEEAAYKYSKSKATTNAGAVLRFVAGLIPIDLVIKIFAHKLTKKPL